MSKIYVFRTPSNQKIEVDSRIYSFYRDIVTVDDLKFLFTSKERLYTMEMFELAALNKATKQNEILNHNDKICDLQIDEYNVIHIDLPKKESAVDVAIETRVKTVVEKISDEIVNPISESEKAVVTIVEKVDEKVVETGIESVDDPMVEKIEEVVETVVDVVETVESKSEKVKIEEEKVVEKKFCLIC